MWRDVPFLCPHKKGTERKRLKEALESRSRAPNTPSLRILPWRTWQDKYRIALRHPGSSNISDSPKPVREPKPGTAGTSWATSPTISQSHRQSIVGGGAFDAPEGRKFHAFADSRTRVQHKNRLLHKNGLSRNWDSPWCLQISSSLRELRSMPGDAHRRGRRSEPWCPP